MDNDLERPGAESPPEATSNREKHQGRRFLLDVLETLFISLILFVGINALTARIRVDGSSMEPSLHHGEFIIVNKLAYRLGAPSIGDVVVFHAPGDPEEEFIKRVIGLPGDRVEISAGQVMVNGSVLNEPYIAAPPLYEGKWEVPEGAIFVLGDNRNNSDDSHRWGEVPLGQVIGKAVMVYWPPDEWGLLPKVTPAVSYP